MNKWSVTHKRILVTCGPVPHLDLILECKIMMLKPVKCEYGWYFTIKNSINIKLITYISDGCLVECATKEEWILADGASSVGEWTWNEFSIYLGGGSTKSVSSSTSTCLSLPSVIMSIEIEDFFFTKGTSLTSCSRTTAWAFHSAILRHPFTC